MEGSLAFIVVFVAIIAAMPWRGPDPRHELIFEFLRRLAKGAPHISDPDFHGSAEGNDGHWISTSRHHRTSRAHL